MHVADLEQLLPNVLRRAALPGTPLGAMLGAMAALQTPAEVAIDHLPATLDVHRTPDRFVAFLARWVDLSDVLGAEEVYGPGTGQLRQLVASAAQLARWRGTSRGLQQFLETATGVAGFTIDEEIPGSDGEPRPYHIAVRVPAAATTYRELVATIVEAEKPVYVTAELLFAESPTAPAEPTGAGEATQPGPPEAAPEAAPEPAPDGPPEAAP